ncbi:MAG: hypothetical protein Q9199_003741 [Rusavskia elegans]
MWRTKLSRSGGKAPQDEESRDQNIQSFLHTPFGGQTAAAPQASRSSFDAQRLSSKSTEPLSLGVRRKPPRKPNLHVAFATTAPVIIGEGGDEAMLPALELLSYVDRFAKPPTKTSREDHRITAVSDRTEAYGTDHDIFRPKALQRRSTGLQDRDPNEALESESPSMNRHPDVDGQFANSLHLGASSQVSDSLPHLPARGSPRFDVIFTKHGENDVEESARIDSTSKDSNAFQEAQAHLLNPATSFANSLTPSPTPPSPRRSDISPERGYPFPIATTVKEPRSSLAKQEPLARSTQQQSQTVSPSHTAENRGLSLRTVAKNFGEDALQDFAARVQPFRNVFLLGLDARAEPKLAQWVTAASWWFIKGRSGLECSVRSSVKTALTDETMSTAIPQLLKQAYVDLAKAWWITSEITPSKYPEVKNLDNKGSIPISSIMQSLFDARTAELVQRHLSIMSNLRALTMSMKRNNRMPPFGLELQGSDVRIFIPYPSLSPSAARLLSSERFKVLADNKVTEESSFFPMPISDTERHFNYGRMFVDVVLDHAKPESQIRLSCLLSVLRDREDREITVVIASQDGQVHLVIQPDVKQRLSWRDVHWKTQDRYIEIDLRADLDLRVEFEDRDFKTMWGIHDYIRTVQKASQASKTETLVHEDTLESFQYFEQNKTAAHFPAEVVEGCILRLFECFRVAMEGSGERRLHDGYRVMVVTPRRLKTLSSVSHNLGRQKPVVFSYLRDKQGAPAILFKTSKSSRDPSMVMSFQEEAERDLLHSRLSGTGLSTGEHYSSTLSLESVRVTVNTGEEKSFGRDVGGLESYKWKSIRVIGEPPHVAIGGPRVRIWAECESGCFVDRINLGPGELLIRLDSDFLNRISISRPPQKDMTVCFADSTLSKEQYEALREMLDQISQSHSVKTFGFNTLKDLHEFQTLVTGFSIDFDGFARTFAISRRRMVVPIHKRWEASVTRLQIVRRDKTMQLVAFFKDFSHGSCMNFALKSTDVFESFNRSGVAYLSIVDAKFPIPKGETDPYHRHISLDMPEYPGEHDDITIGFESEHGTHCASVIRSGTTDDGLEQIAILLAGLYQPPSINSLALARCVDSLERSNAVSRQRVKMMPTRSPGTVLAWSNEDKTRCQSKQVCLKVERCYIGFHLG